MLDLLLRTDYIPVRFETPLDEVDENLQDFHVLFVYFAHFFWNREKKS